LTNGSHADLTVRDYLVKWGEGIEKVFAGDHSDFQVGPNVCSWRDGGAVVSRPWPTIYLTRTLKRRAVSVRNWKFRKRTTRTAIAGGREHALICWTTLERSAMKLRARAAAGRRDGPVWQPPYGPTVNGILGLAVSGSPPVPCGRAGGCSARVPEKL